MLFCEILKSIKQNGSVNNSKQIIFISGSHSSIGSKRLNTVLPGLLWHSIRPPFCFISDWAMERPKPRPSARPGIKGIKMRDSISSEIPGPLSIISIRATSLWRFGPILKRLNTRVLIMICLSPAVAWGFSDKACAAFFTIFSTACISCSGSILTSGILGS